MYVNVWELLPVPCLTHSESVLFSGAFHGANLCLLPSKSQKHHMLNIPRVLKVVSSLFYSQSESESDFYVSN